MNSALTALTATYTDSENEDNHEDDSETSDSENKQTKAEIVIQPKKSSKLTRRLVSYNDNEFHEDASDEELNTSETVPTDNKLDANAEEDKQTKYFRKYGFHLPPETKTKPDPKLQETISNIYQKIKNSDFDLNQYIQEKKEFRNPSIYDKLIQFFDLNELGSNFPPEIFDVSIYGPESYYEELAKAQKLEMEKLEKQKKENVKAEVIIKESTKRKSKWDQQAPASGSSVTTSTSSTTGKTTVISAFGTLKKPKV